MVLKLKYLSVINFHIQYSIRTEDRLGNIGLKRAILRATTTSCSISLEIRDS